MPRANGIFHTILREEGRWIWARARALSNSLYKSSQESEDIFQELCCVALELIHTGWLDQRPTKNRKAQIRHLFGICIKRVRQQRAQLLNRQGDVDEDFFDSVEEHRPSLLHEIIDEQRLEAVHAAVEQLNASRRLTYLALLAPERAELRHFEEAENFNRGGGGLRRDAAEAWELFERARKERSSDTKASEWKRIVAEILRHDGPLGSCSQQALRLSANALEAQISQSRKDLRSKLGTRAAGGAL